jgi:hypothetical protein
MDKYCRENNFEYWCESSAKDNIMDDFHKGILLLVEKIMAGPVVEPPPKPATVCTITPVAPPIEQTGGCC